jgi:excinuclease ABC subunit C
MKIEDLKKFKLPDTPGVYVFCKDKELCYIGKATSLRDRVRSYFSKDLIATRGPLLVDMVFKAERIDWYPTDSVLEALILEAELIKKYQPYYNTREKDDKSWNYVVITREELPRVLVIRGKELQAHENSFAFLHPAGGTFRKKNSHVPYADVFGPFTNGMQLREAMKIIRRIFPYIDKQSAKKDNFEFYRQLGLNPDVGGVEAMVAYKRNIANLKLFFRGKKKEVVRNLKKEMLAYAKNKQFELANEVKKRVFALEHINDIALIKSEPTLNLMGDKSFRIEAYDIAHMGGKNMVGVMTVVEDDRVCKSEYRKFKIKTESGANDTGALVEVLNRRLAHTEWPYPSLIAVDGGKAQLNALMLAMQKIGVMIPLVSVLKDERHQPKNILGREDLARKHEAAILLANSEAHRFAITYHKNMRNKNFLPNAKKIRK